jgi:hypothetical protein
MKRPINGQSAPPNLSDTSLVAVIDLPDEQRTLVLWLMRQDLPACQPLPLTSSSPWMLLRP